MIEYLRNVLLWSLAGGALLYPVLVIRTRRRAVLLSRRLAVLEAEARLHDEEADHFAVRRLPAVASNLLGHPEDVPGTLNGTLLTARYAASFDAVVDLFTGTVEQARTQEAGRARAVVRSAMLTLQSLVLEQHTLIAATQGLDGASGMHQSLAEIDRANARIGRRVLSIGVLAGAGLGPHQEPAALADVVRHASLRIQDHPRVRIGESTDVAVVAEAVEPLSMALAELLDNAARHSPPETLLTVETRAGEHSATIVIDDSGEGMTAEQLHHVSGLLSGRHPVDLCRLGDPPKCGLALVALLSARYKFHAFVGAQSPYGGLRAILHLPPDLLVPRAAGSDTADHGPASAPPGLADDLGQPMGRYVKHIEPPRPHIAGVNLSDTGSDPAPSSPDIHKTVSESDPGRGPDPLGLPDACCEASGEEPAP